MLPTEPGEELGHRDQALDLGPDAERQAVELAVGEELALVVDQVLEANLVCTAKISPSCPTLEMSEVASAVANRRRRVVVDLHPVQVVIDVVGESCHGRLLSGEPARSVWSGTGSVSTPIRKRRSRLDMPKSPCDQPGVGLGGYYDPVATG